jgi:hypothetical protein
MRKGKRTKFQGTNPKGQEISNKGQGTRAKAQRPRHKGQGTKAKAQRPRHKGQGTKAKYQDDHCGYTPSKNVGGEPATILRECKSPDRFVPQALPWQMLR